IRSKKRLRRYGFIAVAADVTTTAFCGGVRSPTAHTTANTPTMPAATTSGEPPPPGAASGGTTSAATATPSGTDICLIPIANPRRFRGNQPTTTRPLAAFADAAAAPVNTSTHPSGSRSTVLAETSAKTAASARPIDMTQRSPHRSAAAPHATSVRTIPNEGAAASRPAHPAPRSAGGGRKKRKREKAKQKKTPPRGPATPRETHPPPPGPRGVRV